MLLVCQQLLNIRMGERRVGENFTDGRKEINHLNGGPVLGLKHVDVVICRREKHLS